MQDPVLRAVKLIAEPWDCGPGGYQVGGFPPGWAEWNDKYRDTVRDFWRGEATPGDAGAAPVRLARYLRAPRPPALGQRQLHHRARRLHAQRLGELQRQAQRGQRRGQQGRPFAQPLLEPRRRRPDRRRRDQRPAQAADAEHAGDAAAVAGHADAARRRRVRAHPAGQQQRLLPGQRDQLGGLERRRPLAAHDRLRPAADRPAPPLSDPAPQALPLRRLQRGARRQGRRLDQRHRRRDGARRTGRTATSAASACCSTAARR